MAWMITRDLLAERHNGNLPSDVGACGPAGITEVARAKMERGEGHMFLMYDDDGELYYEGLLLGDKDGMQGFTPLDHFGTPNAGCTIIQYFNPTIGAWETL